MTAPKKQFAMNFNYHKIPRKLKPHILCKFTNSNKHRSIIFHSNQSSQKKFQGQQNRGRGHMPPYIAFCHIKKITLPFWLARKPETPHKILSSTATKFNTVSISTLICSSSISSSFLLHIN